MCVCSLSLVRLCGLMDCSRPGSSAQGIFQTIVQTIFQNFPGVGYHFLPREIFPSQDQTQASRVSCMDRWILYHWAPWEAQAEMGNYYFGQQWRLRLQKYPAAHWCKFIPRGGSRIQPGLAFTSGTRIFSSAEAWNLKKYKAKCEAYTISKIKSVFLDRVGPHLIYIWGAGNAGAVAWV